MKVRWPILFMVALIATSVVIVAGVWKHLSTYLHNDRQVVQMRAAIAAADELFIDILSAEIWHRDYLLDRESETAERFSLATGRARQALAQLQQRAPAAELSEPVAVFASLLPARLSMLERSMDLARQGDTAAATALVTSAQSKRVGDEFRVGARAFINISQARLTERLDACHSSMTAMTRWVLCGLVALGVVTALTVAGLWRGLHLQRRLNEELARTRDAAESSNRVKDEFLSVLSHELRTPLTPSLLTIDALEAEAPLGSDLREQLATVHEQLELEGQLIDDLLDVSRILRNDLKLNRERTAVHAMLEDVITSHRQKVRDRSLEWEFVPKASRDEVDADAKRLKQVFRHVLDNAAKFTPPSGRVAITTENTDGHLVIQVQDSGIGIDPDLAPRVFERFWQADARTTRRFGGAGVGLTLAKHIVELHHGRIELTSPGSGRGATVCLVLPLSAVPT